MFAHMSASAGCAVESATQLPTAAAVPLSNQQALLLHSTTLPQQCSQQQQQQQQNDLASSLMTALKPILLDEDPQVQLAGCQLLLAVAARAPAALLQQLIQLDCCEHLFEVLRGTLSSCSTRASLAAAALDRRRARGGLDNGSSSIGGAAAAAQSVAAAGAFEAAAEGLQAAAVAGLRCLASQGRKQGRGGWFVNSSTIISFI
jgi:hypothetical protein